MIITKYTKNDTINFSPILPNSVFKISLLKHLDILKNIDIQQDFPKFAEFGSVARTIDLQKHNIYEITKTIKEFCEKNSFGFYYSTPVFAEKRDLNRIFEDIKKIVTDLKPQAIEINNTDILKKTAQDKDIKSANIHIGATINIKQIIQICKEYPELNITGYDCSNLKYNEITQVPANITTKKYFTFGKKELKTLLKCPLNTTKNKTTGLFCSAPCTQGIYEMTENNKKQTFITDGFCHVHIFENKITDGRKDTEKLKKAGITEFISDFRFFD